MSPIISIIVPIFNSEKYLSTCLESLLQQGLTEDEYEILLVNDGSTDNSLNICREYETNHTNIIVYSQENHGVSSARNKGLNQAKGEWVMFVDSDDFVCKNSFQYLLQNYCSDDYDGIRFGTRIMSDALVDKNQECDGEVKFLGSGYDFIKNYGLETFCITWMYRRSFLLTKKLSFSAYKIGEDFFFISKFLLNNPRICSTSSTVYQYLIHPGSATTLRDKSHARRCAYDHLEVNKSLIDTLDKFDLMNKDKELYDKCISTIQEKMPLIFSRLLSSDVTIEEFKNIIKEQVSLGVIPLPRKNDSCKMKLSQLLINSLCKMPPIFPLFRYLYSVFFVPFVLPRLNRDK